MPQLIEPTATLHSLWLEAHREWGPGQHEDGFGLTPRSDVVSFEGFAAWVAELGSQSDPAATIDVGRHRSIYRWIVDGDRVLGGAALREGEDEYTAWAGHIGYGIRPSERGRGLATWLLGRLLHQAPDLVAADRLLAVCAVDNVASARTIEHNGGVFEAISDTKLGPVRRYWITL